MLYNILLGSPWLRDGAWGDEHLTVGTGNVVEFMRRSQQLAGWAIKVRRRNTMRSAKIVLASVLVVIAGCRGSDTTSNTTRHYWPKHEIEQRTPNSLGLDSKKLDSIDELVRQRLPQTTSVLVLRRGYLAYERYFGGGRDDLRPLWSATKSVISILMGVLLGDRWNESVDKSITTLISDIDPAGSTPASAVTLRHVLTMTSGLPGVESTHSLSHAPGTVFVYNQTDPEFVSRAITARVGKSAAKYAEEVLFGPLDIQQYYWEERGGFSIGGSGLSLRSRDMAKLGYLYLRRGYWRNRSIVPAGWVEESTRVQVERPLPLAEYGFFWWIEELAGYRIYYASGAGGQTILVVPGLDMVIVITTAETSAYARYLSIVEDCIIPAANVGNAQ
jgi:CubicO group peptidase (beta-lactamase class C family)